MEKKINTKNNLVPHFFFTNSKTVNKISKTVWLRNQLIFSLFSLIFLNVFSLVECQIKYIENPSLNLNKFSNNLNNNKQLNSNNVNSEQYLNFLSVKNSQKKRHKVLRNTHSHKSMNEESLESGSGASTNNRPEDPLIEAFKLKLLQLLDVDQVPQSAQINMTRTPVPEPIMREYNRLLKLSHSERLRDRGQYYSSPRSLRERPNHAGLNEYDLEDETVRFNSSFVQQITLLPKKVKFVEDTGFYYYNIDARERSWCSDSQLDAAKLASKKQNANKKPKSLSTLNCFLFSLDQKEFYSYDIKSAALYFKLNLNLLRNEIIYLTSNSNQNKPTANIDISSHLYIEVNGNLVKKINMKIVNDEQLVDQYEGDKGRVYFDYVDVRELVENALNERVNQSKSTIRVRVLCTNDLVNLTQSKNGLRRLFSKVDENVALHVRFAESDTGSQSARKMINIRNKRQHGSGNNKAGGNRGGKAALKNFRDCADLRKAGYAANNLTCCRETITFTMDQIGWSHWIYSPRVIEYKYCRGGCYTGLSPRFDNTQIIFKLFEENKSMLSAHCCNIYEYEEDIPFIYGSPPNYLTKMISLNAKSCLCS